MKVALTIPAAGAGKWAWTGWANAFKFFGHEVVDISHQDCRQVDPDLVICSTSQPRSDILLWNNKNRSAKVALNVLAWTDEDLPGINNAGVQATPGNVEYAYELCPDLVFAQYSKTWREQLLHKWQDLGFRLGSMEMAADAMVYPFPDMSKPPTRDPDIFYVGGYWAYKAQNIDRYILPCIRNPNYKSVLVGKGWPQPALQLDEQCVGEYFRNAKVVLNAHEPHSTLGGYDVVERVFKAMYCGGLVISDVVDEIENGFGLEEVIQATPDNYERAVEAIINNNEDYDTTRQDGQHRVALRHTYFNRVLVLLSDLNMIKEYELGLEKLIFWQKEMELL